MQVNGPYGSLEDLKGRGDQIGESSGTTGTQDGKKQSSSGGQATNISSGQTIPKHPLNLASHHSGSTSNEQLAIGCDISKVEVLIEERISDLKPKQKFPGLIEGREAGATPAEMPSEPLLQPPSSLARKHMNLVSQSLPQDAKLMEQLIAA